MRHFWEGQRGGTLMQGARTTVYWLKKAIRARISASKYPEDRYALENIAEMYEQIAERMAELSHPDTDRPPYRGGVDRRP